MGVFTQAWKDHDRDGNLETISKRERSTIKDSSKFLAVEGGPMKLVSRFLL